MLLGSIADDIDAFFRNEISELPGWGTARGGRVLVELCVAHFVHFADLLLVHLVQPIQIVTRFLLSLKPLRSILLSNLSFQNILLNQMRLNILAHLAMLLLFGFLTRYLILEIQPHLDLFDSFLTLPLLLFLTVELSIVNLHLIPN